MILIYKLLIITIYLIIGLFCAATYLRHKRNNYFFKGFTACNRIIALIVLLIWPVLSLIFIIVEIFKLVSYLIKSALYVITVILRG